MTTDRPNEYLVSLVQELCKFPRETEWVEFKLERCEPQQIGEYISALANSAASLARRSPTSSGASETRSRDRRNAFRPKTAKVGKRSWRTGCCVSWPQDRLPLLRGRGRRAARRAARDREGVPPPGAIPGAGVHPGRLIQEEAQGLSREGACAVAHLRPNALRDGVAAERVSGDKVLDAARLPSLLRSARTAAAGEPDGILRRLRMTSWSAGAMRATGRSPISVRSYSPSDSTTSRRFDGRRPGH